MMPIEKLHSCSTMPTDDKEEQIQHAVGWAMDECNIIHTTTTESDADIAMPKPALVTTTFDGNSVDLLKEHSGVNSSTSDDSKNLGETAPIGFSHVVTNSGLDSNKCTEWQTALPAATDQGEGDADDDENISVDRLSNVHLKKLSPILLRKEDALPTAANQGEEDGKNKGIFVERLSDANEKQVNPILLRKESDLLKAVYQDKEDDKGKSISVDEFSDTSEKQVSYTLASKASDLPKAVKQEGEEDVNEKSMSIVRLSDANEEQLRPFLVSNESALPKAVNGDEEDVKDNSISIGRISFAHEEQLSPILVSKECSREIYDLDDCLLDPMEPMMDLPLQEEWSPKLVQTDHINGISRVGNIPDNPCYVDLGMVRDALAEVLIQKSASGHALHHQEHHVEKTRQIVDQSSCSPVFVKNGRMEENIGRRTDAEHELLTSIPLKDTDFDGIQNSKEPVDLPSPEDWSPGLLKGDTTDGRNSHCESFRNFSRVAQEEGEVYTPFQSRGGYSDSHRRSMNTPELTSRVTRFHEVEGFAHGSPEEITSGGLNDSVTSTGSLREEEILKAKEDLGARSMAFIQRLRGAAFRRKMTLTRSRDCLAAHEREHREAMLEAARQGHHFDGLANKESNDELVACTEDSISRPLHNTFKARPLPATTGYEGNGGLTGVPKVEKRKPTIPQSPLLGGRRLQGMLSKSQNEGTIPLPSRSESSRCGSTVTLFRARPIPRSILPAVGGGGYYGVPKVPKRTATIPCSPLLGFRRKAVPLASIQPTSAPPVERGECSESVNNDSISTSTSTKLSTALATSTINNTNSTSQGLEGLEVLSRNDENSMPYMNSSSSINDWNSRHDNYHYHPPNLLNHTSDEIPITTTTTSITAYEPYSTARAEQRAIFDERRRYNEQQRWEKEHQYRLDQIHAIMKELKELQWRI